MKATQVKPGPTKARTHTCYVCGKKGVVQPYGYVMHGAYCTCSSKCEAEFQRRRRDGEVS